MPRLFVALDPPAAVRAALAGLQTPMPGARWMPLERMHLTLRFIGETGDKEGAAVEEALDGIMGLPVPVTIRRLGAFPSRRSPRVLVAVVDAHPALAALQARVVHALAALGLEAERRPPPDGDPRSPKRSLRFRPHLTLARMKDADRRAVQVFLAQPLAPLAFEAAAFHLYASALHPEGARYTRLRSFSAAGGREIGRR